MQWSWVQWHSRGAEPGCIANDTFVTFSVKAGADLGAARGPIYNAQTGATVTPETGVALALLPGEWAKAR